MNLLLSDSFPVPRIFPLETVLTGKCVYIFNMIVHRVNASCITKTPELLKKIETTWHANRPTHFHHRICHVQSGVRLTVSYLNKPSQSSDAHRKREAAKLFICKNHAVFEIIPIFLICSLLARSLLVLLVLNKWFLHLLRASQIVFVSEEWW